METRTHTISEYDYKPVILGTQMPVHIDFSDCCGFFNDLREEGLFCNECGMEISKAIGQFYNEVKDTISDMWGGGKRGVHMNFNGCETDAYKKWIALSEKLGVIEKPKEELKFPKGIIAQKKEVI